MFGDNTSNRSPLHDRVRRQARGQRRIDQLLEAASAVFSEAGYESATTNAIAGRAGVSPGTLYQFFANKEAIAEELAGRYLDAMRIAHDEAFSGDLRSLALNELLDQMLDPVIRCNVEQPAFHELIARSGDSAKLAHSMQLLHEALLERVEEVMAARAPHLPLAQRRRCAEVSVQLVKGVLPLILAAEGVERTAMIEELKRALYGYLEPLIEATTG
jgi:AcrR family transcriptional regulator